MLELLGGLLSVTFDVFTQACPLSTVPLKPCICHPRETHVLQKQKQADACMWVILQKLSLRRLPSLADIGGPVEGCTCIVTGPTRCALSFCIAIPTVQHFFLEYNGVSMHRQKVIVC